MIELYFHILILWQILQNNISVSHYGLNYMMLSMGIGKISSVFFFSLGISLAISLESIEILDAH